MSDLVSIIVPVYNTGTYLAPCLQSLCDQTCKNLEIILVDDGSTDGSGAVCDEFARRDDRIKVIHQKNAGVSAARNAGLDAASGAYLTFVDADDGLVPEAVETALRYLRENNADVVTYGWQKFFSDDGHTEECAEPFSCTEDIPGVLREILEHYSACGGGYPWNKLWRKDAGVCGFSPDLYYFEDLEWVIRMLLRIRKFVVCPECLYRYRVHGGSISQDPAKTERRELGYHRSIERIIDVLEPIPALQSWFSGKYAPEIVNGVLFAARNRYPQLRRYLSDRMSSQRRSILRSGAIPVKTKIRCLALSVLQTLNLL